MPKSPRQIGWSQQENLLWEIEGQLDTISKIISNIPGGPPGPIGPAGPAGANGAPGSVWFYGNTIPTPSAPVAAINGDYYLYTITADVYFRTGGAWILFANIKGEIGNTGAKGDAATVALGTVATGAAGSSVIITDSGTPSDAVFNFTIPRGDKGDKATIAVGTVTTGDAGTAVVITDVGTPSDSIFDFTIPKGDQGNPGVSGISGAFNLPITNSSGTTIVVNHNFNAYPIVQVYDNTNVVIAPVSITYTDSNNVTVVLTGAIPSGTGHIICSIGGVATTVVSKSANYTLLPSDNMVLVTAACTIKLPVPTGLQDKTYYIKHMTTNGVSVIVDGNGANIDDQATWTIIAKYTTLSVFTDGVSWFII